MKSQHVVWIAAVIFGLVQKGCSGQNDMIIDINATSAVFHCRQPLTLRCYGPKNLFVNWQIAESVISNTSSTAQCFDGIGCTIYNNYNGRYTFDYVPSTGISDLTMLYVKSEDQTREYKCNDGTSLPLKPIVKVVPDISSMILQNVSTGNNIEFMFVSKCTRQDLNITWYSTAADGTDLVIYDAVNFHVDPCDDINCTTVNTTSTLELEKISRRKRADGRSFAVNVSYDSITLNFPIPGSYKLKENTVSDVVKSFVCWDAAWCMSVVIIIFGSVLVVIGVYLVYHHKANHTIRPAPDFSSNIKTSGSSRLMYNKEAAALQKPETHLFASLSPEKYHVNRYRRVARSKDTKWKANTYTNQDIEQINDNISILRTGIPYTFSVSVEHNIRTSAQSLKIPLKEQYLDEDVYFNDQGRKPYQRRRSC